MTEPLEDTKSGWRVLESMNDFHSFMSYTNSEDFEDRDYGDSFHRLKEAYLEFDGMMWG